MPRRNHPRHHRFGDSCKIEYVNMPHHPWMYAFHIRALGLYCINIDADKWATTVCEVRKCDDELLSLLLRQI